MLKVDPISTFSMIWALSSGLLMGRDKTFTLRGGDLQAVAEFPHPQRQGGVFIILSTYFLFGKYCYTFIIRGIFPFVTLKGICAAVIEF
ncbi:hypothetical protein BSG1_12946 [Bacillus sp. SG-1]|nr:hypothetical protein BSG1_12946 [Bacillus sp. SG-1]